MHIKERPTAGKYSPAHRGRSLRGQMATSTRCKKNRPPSVQRGPDPNIASTTPHRRTATKCHATGRLEVVLELLNLSYKVKFIYFIQKKLVISLLWNIHYYWINLWTKAYERTSINFKTIFRVYCFGRQRRAGGDISGCPEVCISCLKIKFKYSLLKNWSK